MDNSVDLIKINFSQDNLLVLNLGMAFIMFAISLDIKKEDFENLLSHPKPAIIGMIAQLVIMPLMTLGLVFLFNPPPSVALGMIAISACPGGNNSNYATHLAKGKTALAITTTSISVLVSIVSMPFFIWLGSNVIPNINNLGKPVSLDAFEMMKIVALLIVLPLILGMLVSYQLPKLADKIRKPSKIISFSLFFLIIIGALLSNIQNILNYVGKVFFVVFVLNACALAVGYWFSKLNKLTEAESRAISFETGIHNITLALIIIFNFFDGLGGMALVAAWYGIWDLISGFALAMWWSKRDPEAKNF